MRQSTAALNEQLTTLVARVYDNNETLPQNDVKRVISIAMLYKTAFEAVMIHDTAYMDGALSIADAFLREELEAETGVISCVPPEQMN